MTAMNGILNVYKEKGYTSHDVVAKLRRICGQKKIGHTGTLDPDAEGVLPVCLGTATKVCELLTEKDKVYEAVLLLGKETDTQDSSGTVLRESAQLPAKTEIEKAIMHFKGAYKQIPPMYSALKVNGKKLCDLAREGIEVERKAREVHIYEIEILWLCPPRAGLRVHCSKGTYIRTLCHDIGQELGCGGCMDELLRTRTGIFALQDAWKLGQIEQLAKEKQLQDILLPVDQLFCSYPKAEVKAQFHKMLQNGNRLPKQAMVTRQEAGSADRLRVYIGELFYGIYAFDEARGDYRPVKIFGQGSAADIQQKKRGSSA